MPSLRKRRTALIACCIWLLAVLLSLSGCGEKDSGGVTLETANDNGQPAATPQQDRAPKLELIQTIGGRLVYAQGTGLYLYPGNDPGEPAELTDLFAGGHVIIAPDGKALFYNTINDVDFGNDSMFHVDLTTLEQTPVGHVWGAWDPGAWSPNGEWVILENYSFGEHLLKADGSVIRVEAIPNSADVRWLSDSSLLFVETQPDPHGGMRYARVGRFYPEADYTTDLDIDLDALEANYNAVLDEAVAALNLEFAVPLDESLPRIWEISSADTTVRCTPWQIGTVSSGGSFQVENILYEEDSLYRLSNLVALTDGSYLFMRWSLAECKPLDKPIIELMRLWPDGHTDRIATGLFAGLSGHSMVSRSNSPAHFAVSPDGQYVAWVSGDIEVGKSALHLTELATGEDTVLMSAESDSSLTMNDFIDDQLFIAVYWIAD